ncbi:MAG: hypothetical protein AB7P76_02355 [Candidatus Melainabacteria bacterium]
MFSSVSRLPQSPQAAWHKVDQLTFQTIQPRRNAPSGDCVTFGANNPQPINQLKLQLGDDVVWDDNHRLQPTPNLVKNIADVYFDQRAEAPGYLVITNILDFLGKPEEIRAFQKDLFEAAWKLIHQTTFSDTPIHSFLIRAVPMSDGQRVQPDGFAFQDTYKSEKRPHMDTNIIFLAHSYGPLKDIEGGDLQVTRYPQLLKEKNLSAADLFGVSLNNHKLGPFIKPEWISQLKEYTQTVSSKGWPIIFMNNRHVVHSVTPVVKTGEQPVREFFRTSVQPPETQPYFWETWLPDSAKPVELVMLRQAQAEIKSAKL